MKRSLGWAALFGGWLLGLLGSVLVLFVELSDGSKLGSAFPIALAVLGGCVAAAIAYPFVVPKPSRPPPSTWIFAVLVCLGLMAVIGVFALMIALGAIRG